MPNIFLSEFPAKNEFLLGLKNLAPEIDSYSFYAFLSLRQVTSQLENAMESYFANYGVSPGRFMLLLLLNGAPEGMMPSELAHECGVTQATVSGLLHSLEKSGFISRKAHSHDRRSWMIVIGEKGRALVEQVRPEYFKCLNQMMSPFAEEEKQQLVHFLGRFNETFKTMVDLKAECKSKMSHKLI